MCTWVHSLALEVIRCICTFLHKGLVWQHHGQQEQSPWAQLPMDLSQHAQGAVTPVQHVQTRDEVIHTWLIVPTLHINNTESVHRVNIMIVC